MRPKTGTLLQPVQNSSGCVSLHSWRLNHDACASCLTPMPPAVPTAWMGKLLQCSSSWLAQAAAGAQALSDNAEKGYMKGMRTLEINPRHPLVERLREQVGPAELHDHAGMALGMCSDPASASCSTLCVDTAVSMSGEAVLMRGRQQPSTAAQIVQSLDLHCPHASGMLIRSLQQS